MTVKFLVKATCFDKRGKIISVAFNNYTKSHPMMASLGEKVGLPEKQFLHAEVLALLRAGDKEVHRIFVERYHKNGNPANAAPCPICTEAIRMWGVKYVEHT